MSGPRGVPLRGRDLLSGPGVPGHGQGAVEEWAADSGGRRLLGHTLEVEELDDPALAEVVAEAGLGVFAVPEVTTEDVRGRYKLQPIGRIEELRQRFYAISVERKIKNPAVVAICEGARRELFAAAGKKIPATD